MTAGRIGCLLFLWPLVDLVLLIIAASVWGWQPVVLFVVSSLVLGLVVIRVAITATGRSMAEAMRSLQQRQVFIDPDTSTVIAIDSTPLDLTSPQSAASVTPGQHHAPPATTILLIPAGIALAVPGFLSEIAGLVLLLPGVRRSIAASWSRRLGPGGRGMGRGGPERY